MHHRVEAPFDPKETAMNKKMPKKLVLCTETLRNLDAKDLQHAAGGSIGLTNCAACGTNYTDPCTITHVCSGCAPCF
jgi:hypothetical protein